MRGRRARRNATIRFAQGVPDDRRSRLEVRPFAQGPGGSRSARGPALREGRGSRVAAGAIRSGPGSGVAATKLPRPDRSRHQDVRYRRVRPMPAQRCRSRSQRAPAAAVAGNMPRARWAVDLMNAAGLKAKIEDAKGRLSTAAKVMERALQQIEHAEREDKSMVSGALATALAEMKAARQDLLALEQVIAGE